MDARNIYAFRLQKDVIEQIKHPDFVQEDDLIEIDVQKQLAKRNIEAFLSDKPFLNMLLWGERGCGKSSLIKMLLNIYKNRGLRIVEIYPEHIEAVYRLYDKIRINTKYKFILFFDDISFDNEDWQYRKFKSILEGGMEKKPENVIFIATSNKRHLTKDKVLSTEDIYSHDEINEQLSLFGRFGLILGFYPLSKHSYIKIVKFYMNKYSVKNNLGWEKEAEEYAISRGGRSGRIAKQFVIYKKLQEGE